MLRTLTETSCSLNVALSYSLAALTAASYFSNPIKAVPGPLEAISAKLTFPNLSKALLSWSLFTLDGKLLI